jgi:hypothetical protein
MVDLTISKSKVGPVTARYLNGSYEDVERENEEGVKRMAVLGLDGSHNKDYKVSYASDALVTIQGGRGVSHSDLESVLKEVGAWDLASFAPIEIPHGEEWRAGFKTTPERVKMIGLMYDKFENAVDDHQLIGDEEQFSVYY